MNILKGILLALGVLFVVAILPFNLWDEIQLAETRTATFAAADGAQLYIEGADGDVIVTGVDDLNEVQVNATLITWGNSDREAEENLAAAMLTMEEVDGVVRLIHTPHETGTTTRLRGERGYGLEIGREDEVYFEIKVPRNSSLEIHVVDGDIEIKHINGGIVIDSDDGDAVIRDVVGSFEYASDAGNVEILEFSGSIALTTDDGNVLFSGELVGAEHSVTTVDGDIEMALPSTNALELDVTIDDGDIDSDFPLTLGADSSHYTGAINEPEGGSPQGGSPQGVLRIRVTDDGDMILRELRD